MEDEKRISKGEGERAGKLKEGLEGGEEKYKRKIRKRTKSLSFYVLCVP